jgi:hypothetical protein
VARWVFENGRLLGISTFIRGAPCAFGLGATTTRTINCGSQQPATTFTTVDGTAINGTDITGGGDMARTVWTCNPNDGAQHTFYQWFNTSYVHRPAQGTSGNAPTAPVIGPGTNNWPIALFKNLPIREKKLLFQLRVEAYNTLNHTQFTGLNTTPGFDINGNQVNPAFGQSVTAANPRYVQFAVRVSF